MKWRDAASEMAGLSLTSYIGADCTLAQAIAPSSVTKDTLLTR